MRGAMWLTLFVAAGCQGQEFLPVEPIALQVRNVTVTVLAKQLPPNIMLVVDRSGSMLESVTGAGMACSIDGTANAPYDPQSLNSCKWNDLKEVLADPTDGFLVQSQQLARFGLLAFPGEAGTCSVGEIAVPIGAPVQLVRFQLLNQLAPGGGTPTATALREAAKDPSLAVKEANRRRFVVLLTDGLPNCSDSTEMEQRCASCQLSPAACQGADGCRPTFGSVSTCESAPFLGAACLDESGLVSAVEDLKKQGIESFVFGFGADTAGTDAAQVLSRAAVAGGHPRSGTGAQYYQANSVEELKGFLDQILQAFPCVFPLSPIPVNGDLSSVTLKDTVRGETIVLKRGVEWDFDPDGLKAVHILGGVCEQIQSALDDRYELGISYATAIP